jgi:hypothetical protein
MNHFIPIEPTVPWDLFLNITKGETVSIKSIKYIIELTAIFSINIDASLFLPKYKKQRMMITSPPANKRLESILFFIITKVISS